MSEIQLPTTNDVLSAEMLARWRAHADRGGHVNRDSFVALIDSHERLRAMFEEAAVRIAKQSDALGQRSEKEA